jgi:eukaryotic translation initiation factor 2C
MSKPNRGGWKKNNNNNNNQQRQSQQQQQQQQRSEFLNLNDEDEMPSLPAVLHQQQQQQRSFIIDDNQMPSLPVNLTATQRVVSSPFASAVQEPVKTGPQRSVWGKPPPMPTPTTTTINEPKKQATPAPGFQSATPAPTSLTQQSSIISSIETVTEQMASASIAPSPFESPVKESESSSSSKLDLTEISPPKGASVRVHNGEFPAKRERGNLGRQIKLRANHFHLVLKKAYVVYQYDVELTKKQMPGGAAAKTEEKIVKNKTIMRAMFLILSKKLLGPKYENKIVYNFSKNLYSLEKLPFEKNITYEINIENTTFMLKLQTINQITIDPAKPDDPVQIQVLDLIFTQSFNYSCHNLNRSFFTKNCENVSLGFGLELWKGAYASVRPCEIGLTWNLDVAHSGNLIFFLQF